MFHCRELSLRTTSSCKGVWETWYQGSHIPGWTLEQGKGVWETWYQGSHVPGWKLVQGNRGNGAGRNQQALTEHLLLGSLVTPFVCAFVYLRCSWLPSLRQFPVYNTVTWSVYRRCSWRRAGQPTPGFLPGESQGQRSLADGSPWDLKELDATARLTLLRCCYILCSTEGYCELLAALAGLGLISLCLTLYLGVHTPSFPSPIAPFPLPSLREGIVLWPYVTLHPRDLHILGH